MIGIPTLFHEYLQSYIVVFGLNLASEKIGEELKLPMKAVRKFRDQYPPIHVDFLLRDFRCARWRAVQQKMNAQSSALKYHGSLTSYAFWYAVFSVVVAVLALGVTVAQTYAAFMALQQ